ncbi:hypothetical protein L228DRAFT_263683 [Xylona heveae TC161]|uniref:tRNA(Ile)-lysidine synthetase n=1 Tax=Xylona heveae (strain CBS 132557 / TC161) TaxID=1328760 RepID=A0A164ZPF5_XYLHT|nr:hypothetical protein L228DRAFT_263683 [Xylona heveae TC161]KZF19343.1 hypothetical protein L228DRAFT_263683 [Xylona heveae TC161]
MMPVKGPLPQKALPINVATFYNALKAVWSRPEGRAGGAHAKLAIAVSGGVDSMALATLCRQLAKHQSSTQVPDFRFTAFVVDHGAREGSKEEAQRVLERVRKMGIRGSVLTLNWPKGVFPSQLPNFESQARTLRYKALGEACRAHGVPSILLGHHAEDQAETILMKISRGHGGGGLAGMIASSDIPECYGMHGIHQSGGWEPQFSIRKTNTFRKGQGAVSAKEKESAEDDLEADYYTRNAPTDGNSQYTSTGSSRPNGAILVERGGITIHRPLLNFTKDQLIATCEAAKTVWEEDVTNFDRTLTERNAVRYLLQQRQLPKALQAESVIRLSRRWQERTHDLESRAELAWRANEITLLDVRSGGVVVRFQKKLHGTKRIPEQYLQAHIQKMTQKGARMLRRAMELVSPQETIELPRLRTIVHNIFPDIQDPEFNEADRDLLPHTSFTACGIHFQRIFSPVHMPAEGESHASAETSFQKGTYLDDKYVWMLTRQPYIKASPGPEITIPPNSLRPKQQKIATESPGPSLKGKRQAAKRRLTRVESQDMYPSTPPKPPPRLSQQSGQSYPYTQPTPPYGPTSSSSTSSPLHHQQRRQFHQTHLTLLPHNSHPPESQQPESTAAPTPALNPEHLGQSQASKRRPSKKTKGLAHHGDIENTPGNISTSNSNPPQHHHKKRKPQHARSPSSSPATNTDHDIEAAPWHLWDGRVWIRVSNPTDRDVIIRPLNPQDLHPFRKWLEQHVSPKKVKQLDQLLAAAAPGKVRWTLPVLAWGGKRYGSPVSLYRPSPSVSSASTAPDSVESRDSSDSRHAEGSGEMVDDPAHTCPIIALPTLNFSIYTLSRSFPPSHPRSHYPFHPHNLSHSQSESQTQSQRSVSVSVSVSAASQVPQVRWQVRYKKIHIPPDRQGRERHDKVVVR